MGGKVPRTGINIQEVGGQGLLDNVYIRAAFYTLSLPLVLQCTLLHLSDFINLQRANTAGQDWKTAIRADFTRTQILCNENMKSTQERKTYSIFVKTSW